MSLRAGYKGIKNIFIGLDGKPKGSGGTSGLPVLDITGINSGDVVEDFESKITDEIKKSGAFTVLKSGEYFLATKLVVNQYRVEFYYTTGDGLVYIFVWFKFNSTVSISTFKEITKVVLFDISSVSWVNDQTSVTLQGAVSEGTSEFKFYNGERFSSPCACAWVQGVGYIYSTTMYLNDDDGVNTLYRIEAKATGSAGPDGAEFMLKRTAIE